MTGWMQRETEEREDRIAAGLCPECGSGPSGTTIKVGSSKDEAVAMCIQIDAAIREKVIRDRLRELGYRYVPPGWKVAPEECDDAIATAIRNSLRDQGLLPAYTDEPKGEAKGLQPPLLHHMLKQAWPLGLAAAPEPPNGPEEG